MLKDLNHSLSVFAVCFAIISCANSATASAQVFGLGSSDPALFAEVINLPGDDSPNLLFGIFILPSQLNVAEGGSVGAEFSAGNAEINIIGGSVGDGFRVFGRAEVNISGGSVGDNFCVTFFGNTPGGSFGGVALDLEFLPAVINISGGSVGDGFRVSQHGEINLSGGSVGNGFIAADTSRVNLIGSDFILDGVLLTNLIEDEAFTIPDRDVTLSGLLADGSAFSFDLNSAFEISQDYFDPDAALTVTLVSSVILGDVSLDGGVDFSDIPAFIEILIAGEFQAEADCNQDGVVDFFDIPAFVDILLNN